MWREIHLTEIQILPVKPRDGLVAFASCVLNGSIYLGNIGIHTTPCGGHRLLYPTKVLSNGKQVSCFHPINRLVGNIISESVINRYSKLFLEKEDVLNVFDRK